MLVFWFLVSFSAGWFGSQFKPGVWYENLHKPVWTPPSLAFPIAWTLLYSLMSIAAWMVWKNFHANSKNYGVFGWFFLQLILNALWSWIFFGLHQMGWALIEMLGLWVAIVMTTYSFYKVLPLAGYLLFPYILWVSFAAILNFSLWKMNLR